MNTNDKKAADSATQTIEERVEELSAEEAGKVAGGVWNDVNCDTSISLQPPNNTGIVPPGSP